MYTIKVANYTTESILLLKEKKHTYSNKQILFTTAKVMWRIH